MRYTIYKPVANRGEFHVRDENTRGDDHQPLAVCMCWTLEEATRIAAALNDIPKAAPFFKFGVECVAWFAVDGCVPLSPHALMDEEMTFQEKARELLAPQLAKVAAHIPHVGPTSSTKHVCGVHLVGNKPGTYYAECSCGFESEFGTKLNAEHHKAEHLAWNAIAAGG